MDEDSCSSLLSLGGGEGEQMSVALSCNNLTKHCHFPKKYNAYYKVYCGHCTSVCVDAFVCVLDIAMASMAIAGLSAICLIQKNILKKK